MPDDHLILLNACRFGALGMVQEQLQLGVDFELVYDKALPMAVQNNHIPVLKMLLEYVKPSSNFHSIQSQVFKTAALHGKLETIKLLLEHPDSEIDPTAEKHFALQNAPADTGIVEYLAEIVYGLPNSRIKELSYLNIISECVSIGSDECKSFRKSLLRYVQREFDSFATFATFFRILYPNAAARYVIEHELANNLSQVEETLLKDSLKHRLGSLAK